MTHTSEAKTLMLDSGQLEDSWMGADVAPGAPDSLIGTTLNGTYRVERVIGEGGMGRVYEARHTRIAQKRVAVKVLHQEFARDRDSLARFQREAEAAASISHPNVVAVLDVDQTPQGMPYLVCEYLEGIDLAAHLKNVGTLALDSALHIARQLCLALDAAHACGVVHRDLKPHNVFLVGDFAEGVPARPYAKVLDFGLSRIVHSDAHITRTGIIVGTPAFMAPEQTLGQRADHRADVYGVGAILYKALTGRAPYDQETPQAALTALMKGEPPRLRGLVPSLPSPLELVVERAMARDPAQRYPSTKELGRALEQLAGAPSEKVSSSAPPTARNVVMSEEAREAQGARFGLLMWLLASSLTLTAASAIAITGVERLMRVRLSPLELKLTLSLVLGKFFMPGVLLLPAIRRAWKNTTKVVALLRHVRASMLSAISAIGCGALALQVNDRFLTRFVELGPLPTLDPAWQGWNVVLPLLGLLAALTTLTRRKLLVSEPRTWRRVLAATLVLCCSLGVTYGVVHTALRWRAEHSGADAG